MSIVIIDDSILASIGSAVRAKTGGETKYTLSEMPAAILSIEGQDPVALAESLLDGTITAYSDDTITTLGDSAFASCTQLKEVYCPNVTSIGMQTFYQCSALEGVDVTKIQAVPTSAFAYCSSLKEIILPNATSIGYSAFAMCDSLKKVDIHQKVTIEGDCFTGVPLEALILRSSTRCTINYSTWYPQFIQDSTYIYVPSSLLSSYKSYYKNYAWGDNFRAIESYPDITGG